MIHVSGKEFGYIITRQEYKNYYLRAEFKWGEGTFAPRAGQARDSGILYNILGIDVDKAIDFGAAAVQNLNDGAKMLMDFVAPSLGSNPDPQATPLPLPTPTNNMPPH